MVMETRLLLNAVRELMERGYSPLDVARSLAMSLDDVLKLMDLLNVW